jgi:lysophospholipid acyltransferase (LPLAT)-like uncharacterized protein
MPAMRDEVPDQRDRRVAWLTRIGIWVVHLLGRTWRIRVDNDAPWRRLREKGKPIIFVFWHGQMLPLLYVHRGQGVTVLISEHGDGELIARVASSLGYRTLRGSTSRGAARALIEMTKAIEQGAELAITPDGPRGPARSVAPGAVTVAQRTGVPIIPVGVSVRTGWHLKSWDRFVIPRPFSRIQVVYGDPFTIERANVREAVEEAPRLRDRILAAEQLAGESGG